MKLSFIDFFDTVFFGVLNVLLIYLIIGVVKSMPDYVLTILGELLQYPIP